jgi:hypothetical protein
MPLVNISSADNISGIRLKEQASSPTTPPSGYAQLYVNTTPAVQFEDDAGTVRTLSDTTHVHTIANVTNLQTTLDGKASSVHTHAATDITSGTLADARIPNLAASKITSGTLDNARVNWAAPSAIGGTTAAAGTFSEANVNGAAGTDRWLLWKSAGSNRWGIRTTDTAETGSEVGSNFVIQRFNDSGGSLGAAFAIARATGTITALPTYSVTITSSVRDLQIDSSGNLGYVASARKHKHKIRPIKETNRFIAKLRELNPVRYRYKVDGDGDGVVDDLLTHYGFVAEEVEEVFPELCSYDIVPDEGAEIIRDENGKLDPSVPTHKEIATLNYSEMHAIAIAGLQHALDKIDELEAKVKELERRLVRLEVKA